MSVLSAQRWDDILGHVRVNHPSLARGWFAQLSPVRLVGGVLTIQAGNPLQVQYLSDHCRLAFAEAAQTSLGKLITVAFESAAVATDGNGELGPALSDADTWLQLDPDFVFENFVVGPGNRLANAAAVAVSQSPGRTYNPLFIHGDVGLGKTHLLQAICHQASAQSTVGTTVYISCETFANHFIEAVERGALDQFRYRYRHADMLVIDDIQLLGERERSQEEFFHTFNTLQQAKKQIVLSADCSPLEIPSLERRLVSRFRSGLVTSIDPPCMETRMAILRKKAKLRCIDASEEVIEFVAARVDSNIRELEGALLRLDAISQTRDGVIDLNVARAAIGETGSKRNVSVSDIIHAVTTRFGVRLADLQSKKRTRSLTQPRQLCMYLVRLLTNHSLEETGGYFGGRDHTTVLHANRAVELMCEQDPQFAAIVQDLRETLTRNRQSGT